MPTISPASTVRSTPRIASTGVPPRAAGNVLCTSVSSTSGILGSSPTGVGSLLRCGVGLDVVERRLQLVLRDLHQLGGAAGDVLHAVEDGLRLLVDLDELEQRRVVAVLGADGEDVDVRQRVGVLDVVGGQRVLEGEPGLLDEVVVDH